MSKWDQGTDIRSDDMLEQLLKKAEPRPVPSQQDESMVRQAVKAEWQSVTGKRRRQRRVVQYAMAATVILGVFAVFSLFRTPVVESVQVASIEKSFGAIYMLGESAELLETRDIRDVRSGQTIVTGDDAGLALAWGGGGSLRVDANSRVEFASEHSVYLRSGRVYFDSMPSGLIAGINAGGVFSVLTDYGVVTHQGTQFMALSDSDALVVSVREGQVVIDGTFHDHVVSPGEQVTLTGRQRPSVLNISRSGDGWRWIGRTSPAADVDGKSVRQFLDWACRELGLDLVFEGQAEQVSQDAILHGTIDTEPAEALRMRLASAALNYRINEGVLYVSDANP